MSYCRWSSDDWQCDIYCYESVMGGYQIEVADRRPLGIPKNPFSPVGGSFSKWFNFCQHQLELLGKCEYEDIGHPLDQRGYNEPTAKACAERLIELKNKGYNVPQYAIDALLEESEEEE